MRSRAAASASSPETPCSVVRRASSRPANAAWPSLRWTTPGSMPSALQRPHAADAEQRVLPQPHLGVADVEPRGDPAVGDAVLRPVGVEQQQRDAADVDPPDLGDDVAPDERHGHGERLAVVAGDERGGHAVGIGVDPVLVLPAGAVDALAEVAVAVHQPDRDQRHGAVGGLLEDVAGQHAEAAGVDRAASRGSRTRRRRRRPGSAASRRGARPAARPRSGPRARACPRARGSARRSRASSRRPGCASCSCRTGLPSVSSQRSGSISANSSGPPGVHDQR